MSAILSTSHHNRRSALSTSCILSPYSEITKRLLADSTVLCQVQHLSFRSDTSGETWHKIKVNPIVKYIRALRWTPIPLGLGFALIAYQQLRHIRKRESAKLSSSSSEELIASNFSVSLYAMLPLRATSRFWGWMHNVNLPTPLRKPALSLFASRYGCNLKEAVVEDLTQYKNLGEFFSRQLKPEARPVHTGNCLVSPSDGEILHFGQVENGLVEQVKGITYSLKSFLGIDTLNNDDEHKITDEEYHKHLLTNKDNALYHCVIYLAPGDYHKFHSPAVWTVTQRRHFPGKLLSVRPGIVNWIAGLFNINERVVYTGQWEHGFFSLTAVGATNVGSIKVLCDETLQTNKKKWTKGYCEEKLFSPPVLIKEKGEPFGEFQLGSTIVLIFEAPEDIKFNIRRKQKIKYGELISYCKVPEQNQKSS